jgi:hypothetical protein
MHGLINRSIQSFLRNTYGPATWSAVLRNGDFGHDSFEPMLTYPAELTDKLLQAAAETLGRPKTEILEDLGTYLVSHPNLESLRRLLRFGGLGFLDFLHSLEDLPDRARLALSDLDLPALILLDQGQGHYRLLCASMFEGAGFVVVGLLRAMADDYGALVLLDHQGGDHSHEVISVHLLDQSFTKGKRFDLATPVGQAT